MINNFLFKIWIFNFDFATIISFLFGIIIGMVILLLIYALVVVSSIKTKDFIIKTEQEKNTGGHGNEKSVFCMFHTRSFPALCRLCKE